MKKYRFLLVALRALMYLKRGLWVAGAALGWLLGRGLWPVLRGALLVKYKLVYWFKKYWSGKSGAWWLERDVLQMVLLLGLFLIVAPESRLFAKTDPTEAGRSALAYSLIGSSEIDTEVQEIVISQTSAPLAPTVRRESGLQSASGLLGGAPSASDELAFEVTAGGSAILKPVVFPGATRAAMLSERTAVLAYEVVPGDSLGSIARRFGVSLITILWENSLTERSTIRPGNILKIPPTNGVMHAVKKGDTVLRIAKLYGAKSEEIISFNKLKANGAGLIVGERIMVPGGVKPRSISISRSRLTQSAQRMAAPPRSLSGPSASGFVWPTGAHNITQYFTWKHHALDIAGPWQTPNYAAKAGTVEKAQCGWNNGYGCVVIIDHGGGVKTLYGHNSVLLVSAGDYVEAGQTIGLMGNTGHVRGRTGIHLHFEVIINGVRRNPLGYVR